MGERTRHFPEPIDGEEFDASPHILTSSENAGPEGFDDG